MISRKTIEVSTIRTAIAKCEDWKQKKKLLTSVPGVGEIVATTLISSLPELGKLSHKSISYLVGLAPLNRDSPKGYRFATEGSPLGHMQRVQLKTINQPSNELMNAQTSKKL